MNRIILALCALLFAGSAHAAGDAPVAAPPVAAPTAETPAHVALWKVSGKASTVYLLGSVHLLSPTLQWRDARIDKAIGEADAFFFETALDQDAIKQYVAARGTLPPGQSLRAMLPPDSQKDLDDDMVLLGMPEAAIDGRRPWLAGLAMIGIKYMKTGLSAQAGVDLAVIAEAQARGKPLRYFETAGQQLALLAPDDPKLELESFEMLLKDFKSETDDVGPMVEAWAAGDTATLDKLFNKGFDNHPVARKAVLDDRNKAWVDVLKSVLDTENGTFFVTVGAGHLVGRRGVPVLLGHAGYRVERL
ncbi:MAG: TraB/GumN family protein [Rhizomicrobium sp.]